MSEENSDKWYLRRSAWPGWPRYISLLMGPIAVILGICAGFWVSLFGLSLSFWTVLVFTALTVLVSLKALDHFRPQEERFSAGSLGAAWVVAILSIVFVLFVLLILLSDPIPERYEAFRKKDMPVANEVIF